jgi:hyperosmotically inducible protein
MTLPRLFLGVLAALTMTVAACNRSDVAVDTREVREDAKVAAERAQVAAAKASDTFADNWLTAKIQAQYFADEDIRARDIDVTSKDGTVTLRGRVADENAHLQAVQTARNTDGVKVLNDELEVGPLPAAQSPAGAVATTGAAASEVASRALGILDDTRITSAIRSKYFLDDDVKARRIDVTTSQGVVTLKGEVASDAERAQALLLARSTDGVRRVEDALAVNATLSVPAAAPAPAEPPPPSAGVDDATVTTKIQAKFFLDRDVKAGALQVSAKDGVVLLDGTMPTQAAKDRALTLARETDGVLQVIDRVKVSPARRR